MTDPSSTSAPPFTMPTTLSCSVSSLDRVADFFLEHIRGRLPSTTACSSASRGILPEMSSRFPRKNRPTRAPKESSDRNLRRSSPRREDCRSRQYVGNLAIDRARRIEWLRGERAASAADDDVGAARFQSHLPAFFKTARHSDQGDDRGDANGDSGESKPGTQRTAQKTRG